MNDSNNSNTNVKSNSSYPIRLLLDKIKKYKQRTPPPNNQLGHADYIRPIVEDYEEIKRLIDQEISILNGPLNHSGGRRKTRKRSKHQ